jgi:transposase-like protein
LIRGGVSGDLHQLCERQDPRWQIANRPIYVALAVTVEGTRDIFGLWAGEHGVEEFRQCSGVLVAR